MMCLGGPWRIVNEGCRRELFLGDLWQDGVLLVELPSGCWWTARCFPCLQRKFVLQAFLGDAASSDVGFPVYSKAVSCGTGVGVTYCGTAGFSWLSSKVRLFHVLDIVCYFWKSAAVVQNHLRKISLWFCLPGTDNCVGCRNLVFSGAVRSMFTRAFFDVDNFPALSRLSVQFLGFAKPFFRSARVPSWRIKVRWTREEKPWRPGFLALLYNTGDPSLYPVERSNRMTSPRNWLLTRSILMCRFCLPSISSKQAECIECLQITKTFSQMQTVAVVWVTIYASCQPTC